MPRTRREPPHVAVVGAGMCGIAVGVRLLQAGHTHFDILEAGPGVGGTWRVNTYPGAAVDVHSSVYQYSFKNEHWRRTHARQPELLAYLEETVKEFGLEPHIELNAPVERAVWDESRHQYLLTVHGQQRAYDVLVAATGFLITPNMPDWPGLADFEGPVFHSSQWDHEVDLTGKHVAVVGVGSSAAQIVPAIQPVAGHVTVFQREPGWVLPKRERAYDRAELERRRSLWVRKLERWKMFAHIEWHMSHAQVYVAGSKRNVEAEKNARAYIDRVFADRPDLREAMTPSYRYSGKRRVQSDDFYPALLNPNVTVVPQAVTSVTRTGVVDATGVEHPVDVLVIATGFQAWNYLSRLPVVGRDGVEIQETWRDGAYALAGITVPGYPNLYILYGPNTNGSGHIGIASLAEEQATWIIRDLRRMQRHGYTAIDTRPRVVAAYNRWLQKRLSKTAWAEANNYMKGPRGNIVTQFHGAATLYWILLQVLRPLGTRGRRLATKVSPGSPR